MPVTVAFVQNLIDHGCKTCGSVPVNAGNDVNEGELEANMLTNAHRDAGDDILCGQISRQGGYQLGATLLSRVAVHDTIQQLGFFVTGVGLIFQPAKSRYFRFNKRCF